jgi:hypothetical protein
MLAGRLVSLFFADVAELVDAQRSGRCESNFVEVRVLSSASRNPLISDLVRSTGLTDCDGQISMKKFVWLVTKIVSTVS